MTHLHTGVQADWKRVATEPLDQLVHLSRLIGHDPRLVQPGGGNTSLKEGDLLLVKGSGTDLRTITRDGFSRLSLSGLAKGVPMRGRMPRRSSSSCTGESPISTTMP